MSGRHGTGTAHPTPRRTSSCRKARGTDAGAGGAPGVVDAMAGTRAHRLVARIPEAPNRATSLGLRGLLRDDGLTFVVGLQALARRCRAQMHRVSGSNGRDDAAIGERPDASVERRGASCRRAPCDR